MICTVPECDAPSRTQSTLYCEAHYYRLRRGSKLGLAPLGLTCKYCDKPVKRRGSFYCSPSCNGRFSRGTAKGKQFQTEPEMLLCDVREWREVPNFPDYEISNDGRLRRKTIRPNRRSGENIRCRVNSRGYPSYSMSRDGKRYKFGAHQIVAWAFLPPPKPGQEMALHGDDNKLNCRFDNIRWGDAFDNADDATKNGRRALGDRHPARSKPWLYPRGEKCAKSKLTGSDVISILSDTRRQKDIAAHYGVDPALIYRIKAGKVWRHITNPSQIKSAT